MPLLPRIVPRIIALFVLVSWFIFFRFASDALARSYQQSGSAVDALLVKGETSWGIYETKQAPTCVGYLRSNVWLDSQPEVTIQGQIAVIVRKKPQLVSLQSRFSFSPYKILESIAATLEFGDHALAIQSEPGRVDNIHLTVSLDDQTSLASFDVPQPIYLSEVLKNRYSVRFPHQLAAYVEGPRQHLSLAEMMHLQLRNLEPQQIGQCEHEMQVFVNQPYASASMVDLAPYVTLLSKYLNQRSK